MRTLQNTDKTFTTGKASVIAREFTYADLDITFTPNPVTGDINPLKDIEAIKRSIRNLVMTNYNERAFQPEIGSGIRALLFEPVDTITAHELEEAIKRTIENFEPRVTLFNVNVLDNADFNQYDITIEFQINSTPLSGTVVIALERLR